MTGSPNLETTLEQFPTTVKLKGSEPIELRLFGDDDREAIQAFAKRLDEQDLLFLRVDLTKPEVVNNWLANIKSGATISLIAYNEDAAVGYATLDRNLARWTRRVGEIRVNVAAEYRQKGLGRQLIAKIFDVAYALELKKITAQMTPNQTGAQTAFKRLGFVPEALLADYVEDRAGKSHDLVVMSFEVDGLTDYTPRALRV